LTQLSEANVQQWHGIESNALDQLYQVLEAKVELQNE